MIEAGGMKIATEDDLEARLQKIDEQLAEVLKQIAALFTEMGEIRRECEWLRQTHSRTYNPP